MGQAICCLITQGFWICISSKQLQQMWLDSVISHRFSHIWETELILLQAICGDSCKLSAEGKPQAGSKRLLLFLKELSGYNIQTFCKFKKKKEKERKQASKHRTSSNKQVCKQAAWGYADGQERWGFQGADGCRGWEACDCPLPRPPFQKQKQCKCMLIKQQAYWRARLFWPVCNARDLAPGLSWGSYCHPPGNKLPWGTPNSAAWPSERWVWRHMPAPHCLAHPLL